MIPHLILGKYAAYRCRNAKKQTLFFAIIFAKQTLTTILILIKTMIYIAGSELQPDYSLRLLQKLMKSRELQFI